MIKWNKLWLFGHPPLHSLSWSLSSATWGKDKRISVAVWWRENWPKARQMFCYSSEPLCWPRTSSIFKSASQINHWFTREIFAKTPTNAAFVPTLIRIFIDIKQCDRVWSCCTWLYAFASGWAAVLVFIRKRLPGSQRQSLFQVEKSQSHQVGLWFCVQLCIQDPPSPRSCHGEHQRPPNLRVLQMCKTSRCFRSIICHCLVTGG